MEAPARCTASVAPLACHRDLFERLPTKIVGQPLRLFALRGGKPISATLHHPGLRALDERPRQTLPLALLYTLHVNPLSVGRGRAGATASARFYIYPYDTKLMLKVKIFPLIIRVWDSLLMAINSGRSGGMPLLVNGRWLVKRSPVSTRSPS